MPLVTEARSYGTIAYERGSLWAIELGGSYPPAPELGRVSWAEATMHEASQLASVMKSSPQEVRQRIERGARCFTAAAEGELAAYGWITPGAERIGELEREIRLGPLEAYVWDCVTLPAFRRRGLYSGLLRLILATMSKEEYKRVWIGASLSNRPSIKGFVNAGFRPMLTVVYVRVGWTSCLLTRRFRGASRPMAEGARAVLAAPEERRLGPLFLRRLASIS